MCYRGIEVMYICYIGNFVFDGWYLFVRVSILTLSTIFLLDCCGNVQTRWYLFVRYQF